MNLKDEDKVVRFPPPPAAAPPVTLAPVVRPSAALINRPAGR